jgi:hypothetical protein
VKNKDVDMQSKLNVDDVAHSQVMQMQTSVFLAVVREYKLTNCIQNELVTSTRSQSVKRCK